jgi:lipid-A-disaccharide synthase
MKPQRLYLVAGEASGDLHGANLIRSIKNLHPGAEIRCWGGDLMRDAGAHLVSHYRERAFMGLWEVIKNIRTIRRFLKQAQNDILAWKPDVLVLIDNPGFNLRLAKVAHRAGIPVHYYIAPKVWAWNTGRVKQIKQFTDKVYAILPFEKEFFSKHGIDVEYVGNPVVDAVHAFQAEHTDLVQKDRVALLPGSRANEIASALPVMAELAKLMPDKDFVVAAAPSFPESYYQQFRLPENVKLVYNDTYSMLAQSRVAVVSSGTATLETALLGIPQVVCYKVAALTYAVGKRVIKVPYISLVNLVLNRKAVPELIQSDFNPEMVQKELMAIWEGEGREQQLQAYRELAGIMGEAGASKRVAEMLARTVREREKE